MTEDLRLKLDGLAEKLNQDVESEISDEESKEKIKKFLNRCVDLRKEIKTREDSASLNLYFNAWDVNYTQSYKESSGIELKRGYINLINGSDKSNQ